MPKHLSIPQDLIELVIYRRLEHFTAQESLVPTHTPATAASEGYVPLSKSFVPRYEADCRQMFTLKRELERDFDIAIVAMKGGGYTIWKRSRLRTICAQRPM